MPGPLPRPSFMEKISEIIQSIVLAQSKTEEGENNKQ